MAAGLKDCPVDAAIVGIVDTVEVHDEAPAEAHAHAGAAPQGRVTVPGD